MSANPVLAGVTRYVTPASPVVIGGPGGPFSAVRMPPTRMVTVGSPPVARFGLAAEAPAVEPAGPRAKARPARLPASRAAPAARPRRPR